MGGQRDVKNKLSPDEDSLTHTAKFVARKWKALAVVYPGYYLETILPKTAWKKLEQRWGHVSLPTPRNPPTNPDPPLFRNGSSFLCIATLKGYIVLISETLKVPLVVNVRHQHSHYKWLIFAGTIKLNGSINSNVNLLIYKSNKHLMDGNKCAWKCP